MASSQLYVAITYYGTCSSLLLVVNKFAIAAFPAPVSLLALQLWFAAIVTRLAGCTGIVHVDALSVRSAISFMPVVLSFLGTIFANIKVLQYTNVETFITFRSSTPIVLSLCDYLFLGRTLPNARSVSCLVCLAISSIGYALVDSAFLPRAYAWLAAWYVSFTVYEVVVKHLCDTIEMSNWTRVLYTNVMAGSILALILPFLVGEHAVAQNLEWSKPAVNLPVLISCLIGLCVTHAVYVLRCAASATLSAVVGILCKVVSVLISFVVWDKPVTTVELAFLAMGLAAGSFYQQAPMRPSHGGKTAEDGKVALVKK